MKQESIHSGHRQRLKQAMLEADFQGISDINLLEAVLFYSIHRGDTNEIAHRLLNAFGSVEAVFEASYDNLLKVQGIGAQSAFLIKLVSKTAKRISAVDTKKSVYVNDSNDAAEIMLSYFIGEKDERMIALYLDNNSKLIRAQVLAEGVANSVSFNNRKLMEGAIQTNCATVILGHNHPHGLPNPSKDDLRLTHMVRELLRPIDVLLYDHLIYADGNWRCVSELEDAAQYLSILELKKRKEEQLKYELKR
ncbi:MAG: DNA repair protein RadC [Clostridia bacterium]|nr:DNA repair protein RadC [Clostridia bacterium]